MEARGSPATPVSAAKGIRGSAERGPHAQLPTWSLGFRGWWPNGVSTLGPSALALCPHRGLVEPTYPWMPPTPPRSKLGPSSPGLASLPLANIPKLSSISQGPGSRAGLAWGAELGPLKESGPLRTAHQVRDTLSRALGRRELGAWPGRSSTCVGGRMAGQGLQAQGRCPWIWPWWAGVGLGEA